MRVMMRENDGTTDTVSLPGGHYKYNHLDRSCDKCWALIKNIVIVNNVSELQVGRN